MQNFCHSCLVHLAEAVVRTGPHVLYEVEVFYLKKSSRASELLYLIERGGVSLQKPGTIAMKFRIVLTELF